MPQSYPIAEALKAQSAMREEAGLEEETFPVEDFIGMVSDEIESLRKRGKNDDDIAAIIRSHSAIEVTGEQIARNYASPELRGHRGA